MHERLFKQRSFDDSVLAKFTNKTNQSFNDFLAQFDYKNDPNVIIGDSNTSRFNRILKSFNDNQTKNLPKTDIPEKKSDEREELEIIDLDKVECKKHSFWENKTTPENKIIITKFDNFIPDSDEENFENENNSSEIDEFLTNINNSYVPSGFKLENIKETTTNTNETPMDSDVKVLADFKAAELQSVQFPGEIPSSSNKENDLFKYHLRQLDIFTPKIEYDVIPHENVTNECIDNNLVERFELDPNYDYSQNINKPRFAQLPFGKQNNENFILNSSN